MSDHPADNTIELILPARVDMAATLRLLSASLGADCGFSVDEIDDVRLALNEVFTSAAETAGANRISITFRPGHHRLEVMVFMVGPGRIELDDLATRILESVADAYHDLEGTLTFTKLAVEAIA